MDRAHRIGQTNPVTVYRILAESTIEARIMGLQGAKTHVAGEVMTEENSNIASSSSSGSGSGSSGGSGSNVKPPTFTFGGSSPVVAPSPNSVFSFGSAGSKSGGGSSSSNPSPPSFKFGAAPLLSFGASAASPPQAVVQPDL